MNSLRHLLEKNPGDADTQRKLIDMQAKLLDMLVEEMADQSRDIDTAKSHAGRVRYLR